MMAEDCLKWAGEGRLFDEIANVQHQIDGTTAYIMVDDLNHLVGGDGCQMVLPSLAISWVSSDPSL